MLYIIDMVILDYIILYYTWLYYIILDKPGYRFGFLAIISGFHANSRKSQTLYNIVKISLFYTRFIGWVILERDI